MRVRRIIGTVAISGATLLVLAQPAWSSAGTTHPDSVTFHDAVDVFASSVPCNDQLGGYLVTTTYNGQTHSTANDNGFWITGTETGTFTAVPVVVQLDAAGNPVVDPDTGNLVPVLDTNGNPVTRAGETFTGRFVDWFGASINRNVSTVTDTSAIQGVGSAGTTFHAHDNSHVVTDGPGDPFDPSTPLRVAFDHANC